MQRSLPFLFVLAATLGATPALAQIQLYEVEGTSSGNLGWSVASVGDVDNDNYEDFAVGSPKHNQGFNYIHIGKVTILSGRTGDVIRTHLGVENGDEFGYSIDGIGDIDLDGHDDYIVGAPFHDVPGGASNGGVYVFSGQTGTLVAVHFGQKNGDTAGTSVSGLGDVTGDGRPDYAYGASGMDFYFLGNLIALDIGFVLAYSGADHALLWGSFAGEDFGYFGSAIDELGDVSGDGIPDLVVGAPYVDSVTLGADTGQVWILSGVDGTVLGTVTGVWTGGLYGISVAGVGDATGDGVPDFAVGAPLANSNGVDSGEVRLSNGTPGFTPHSAFSGVAGSQAGASVAGVGDVDGDGRNDYAYGMPMADFLGSVDAGMVQVRPGPGGAVLASFVGTTGSQLGNAVAGFDVNKDGRGDLLAGGASHTNTVIGAGLARLYLLGVDAPTTYCTAKVNSAGCTPAISYTGAPSLLTGPGFTVRASKILKNVPGLMIWSRTSNAVPFGGGTLCLGGPVNRTSGQVSGPGVLGFPCSGSFQHDIGFAFAFLNGLSAGDTIYTQFWSRDTGFAAPDNMNLTDGLEITLMQ